MTEKINIKNVAKLAAIKLTSEEELKLEKDLSMIIDHFAALSEMELPDEKITIHPLGMSLNLAEDEAFLKELKKIKRRSICVLFHIF